MKADLTPKQAELLRYIRRYQAEHGCSPSFSEMQEALELKSKSSVHRIIGALQDRGFIRRGNRRARSVEILRDDVPAPASCCPTCGQPFQAEAAQ